MVDTVKLDQSFKKGEFRDGDIVCFQRALTEQEYDCAVLCFLFCFVEPLHCALE